MRFHVIALPHTKTNKTYDSCAFTAKVRKFCEMMISLGHTVYHYGAEGSDVQCTEHISVITDAEQLHFFGVFDSQKLHEVDWSGKSPYWKLINDRCVEAINKRKQPKDFLCLIASHMNDAVVQGTELLPVEYGIGYNGPSYPFRVYESYAHMHRIMGQQCPDKDIDGHMYQCVIPNYFDPADFPLKTEKSDYYLYIGRLINRKGISVAVQTCNAIGARLVLAGQGCKRVDGDRIECTDGGVYSGVEYVGCVVGEERAKLYQNARGVFVPTLYLEPFGGTAVEAQLCGTPVITTDFGVFSETVEHGRTGYRCRTLDQFIWAAKNVGTLDPRYIHNRAVANWSMDRVRWMYQEYFEMLTDVFTTGWPTRHDDRKQLDWLRRY